jgi:hypothetical protein
MTTLREAAQQALEALEMLAQPTKTNSETPRYKAHKAATTALRDALAQEEQPTRPQQMRDAGYTRRPTLREMAQQEQEPVAWRYQNANTDHVYLVWNKGTGGRNWTPLYTAPPRREWRGLTMQEINALPEVGGRMWNMGSAVSVLRAIRAVEAKLKERNT